MIVVDVNVVAYLLVEGEKTAAAQRLLQRYPDWRLPVLWRHEYLNILATFARAGGVTADEARMLWRRAVALFVPQELSVDMESALALAVRHRISAYDAQYLALAQQIKTICVTEDKRLLKMFPLLARNMQTQSEIEDKTK